METCIHGNPERSVFEEETDPAGKTRELVLNISSMFKITRPLAESVLSAVM
jgi:hypothetical protein